MKIKKIIYSTCITTAILSTSYSITYAAERPDLARTHPFSTALGVPPPANEIDIPLVAGLVIPEAAGAAPQFALRHPQAGTALNNFQTNQGSYLPNPYGSGDNASAFYENLGTGDNAYYMYGIYDGTNAQNLQDQSTVNGATTQY